MVNQNKILKLFTDSIPVKGFCRSAIFDLSRQEYHFIPNALFHILSEYQGLSLNNIILKYGDLEKPILHDYFKFLAEKELIYWCDSKDQNLFPKLSLDWDFPGLISNAIIQVENESAVNKFKDTINQLEKLGCKHLQIVSYNGLNLSILNDINFLIRNSSIEVFI